MKKLFYLVSIILLFFGTSLTVSAETGTYVIIKANNQSGQVTLPYGTAPTLSWASGGDLTSCSTASSGMPSMTLWGTSGVTSAGSAQVDHLTRDTVFSITCTNSDQTVSVTASVYVRLEALVMPLINYWTSSRNGIASIGEKITIHGQGFLPDSNDIIIGTSIDGTGVNNKTTTDSTDRKTLSFTVPTIIPGSYNLWISNWNGISNFTGIVVSVAPEMATTTPPITAPVVPPETTPPPITTPPPAVPTPPAQTNCVSLSSYLKYASRDSGTGGEVTKLQKYLNGTGYLRASPTGYFGTMTLAAVKQFQKINGISQVGSVGPTTRAKIRVLTCGS